MAKLLCNLGVVHLYPNFSFLLLLIVFRFKINKRCFNLWRVSWWTKHAKNQTLLLSTELII